MKKHFFLLLLAASFLPAALHAAAENERWISVSGNGSADIKPDQVRMNFGIETSARDIKSAQQDNARRTEAFLSTLRKIGISDKKVKTTAAQINPRYDYVNGQQRFAGYVASKNFVVQLDDVESYGKVLEATIDAGITQTGGIEFDTSKRKGLEDQALKEAVQDAERRADVLAAAAGRKRGEALTIEASSVERPVPMFAAKAMSLEGAPRDQVAAGEISVRASVQVKFRLD